MKGLVWKIALVTAVLAVGFLVILQAQRGMTQAMLQKADRGLRTAASTTGAADHDFECRIPIAASSVAPKADPFGDAGPSRDAASHLEEPNGTDAKNGPTVIAPVAAKEPEKPAATSTAPTDPKEAAASDPFSDGGDAKRSTPAVASKSAASNGPEVKQISGSSDANSKSPDAIRQLDPLPTPVALRCRTGDANEPESPARRCRRTRLSTARATPA